MIDSALQNAGQIFRELAQETADPPGVTRDSFGSGEAKAHAILVREAKRLGVEYRTDAIGNLYLTLPGKDRNLPALLTGSHLDSVPHGGNFDGAAGVVAGLALLECLQAGPQPERDVTLMAIRAEEMIWFPEHYLGSRAAFGLLDPEIPDRVVRSDTGHSLASHMTKAGFDPQAIREKQASLKPESICAFLELHIEQGPTLVERSYPVGIVTAIRGNRRYRYASITGQTTHAGGVPRRSRRDAVLAAAHLATELEREWIRLEEAGQDIVLTLGQFATDSSQHGITKVPGRLDFTLDFRSASPETLNNFDLFINETARRIASERDVEIDLGRSTHAREAVMDSKLRAALQQSAARCDVPALEMASGGGHDCAVFSGQGIPSAMVFVRNDKGSHNPEEAMDLDDFSQAFRVLLDCSRTIACGTS